MRCVALTLVVLAVACSGPAPTTPYETEHLERLVLTTPPGGTEGGKGTLRSLDDVSLNDPERRRRFQDAGFAAVYQTTFRSSLVAGPDAVQGFLMTSRAYLFEDAGRGLEAIEEIVRSEGTDLREEDTPVLGRSGLVLIGTIDPALPSGALLAWTKRNVVLVLVAVAGGGVNVPKLREIAASIDALEPPGFDATPL